MNQKQDYGRAFLLLYTFSSPGKKDPAINDDHMHNDDHVYAGRWRRNGVGVHVPMDRVHVKRTLLPRQKGR